MSAEKRDTQRCPMAECPDIVRLEKENVRMWDSIGKMMSVKIWLAIQAILGAAYLALFSFSLHMNSNAIAQIKEVKSEWIEQASVLADGQKSLMIGVAQLQTITQTHTQDITDVKRRLNHSSQAPHSSLRIGRSDE